MSPTSTDTAIGGDNDMATVLVTPDSLPMFPRAHSTSPTSDTATSQETAMTSTTSTLAPLTVNAVALHDAVCTVKHRTDTALAKCIAKHGITSDADQPDTSDADTSDTSDTSDADTSDADQPATPAKCRKTSPKGHTWLSYRFDVKTPAITLEWSCSACGRKTTSDPTIVTDDQPDQPTSKPAIWAPVTDDQPVTTITITDMVNRATVRRDGYVNGAKELASDIYRAFTSGMWAKVMRDKNGESVRKYPTWETFTNAMRVKSAFNVRDNGVRNVRNALAVAMYHTEHADGSRTDQPTIFNACGMTRSGFAKLAARLELNWYDKTTSDQNAGNDQTSDADTSDQPATPATPPVLCGIPAKYVDALREMSVRDLLKVIGTDAAVELSAHLETLASDQPDTSDADTSDADTSDQPTSLPHPSDCLDCGTRHTDDQPCKVAGDQPATVTSPTSDQPATVKPASRPRSRGNRKAGQPANVVKSVSDADMAAMFDGASV